MGGYGDGGGKCVRTGERTGSGRTRINAAKFYL
jgi:hypothetical protein